ncbi:MAG: ABC transporter substrate-binding protein [Deltaproteobacteria bacterium]|nr:ABC transporter substrate-binding protein [Deltaproteobacteria bacterium]
MASLADDLKADPPKKKWKVIYVEGGNYKDYYLVLSGLIHGLKNIGLIDYRTPPAIMDDGNEDTSQLWSWLSINAVSDRLEFLADGYYSAGWNDQKRLEIKKEILRRLNDGNDVDLVLTFGTWAGQDLVTDEHQVPVMSITVTDPVAAGISRTETDSGLDHAHVQVENGRNERQIRIFHDIFKFRRLGVPYDVTPSGQSTMGVPTIRKMAEELGFELVPCETRLEIDDQETSFQNLLDCVSDLSEKSDAIYLTVNNGMQGDRIERILAPIIKARIPSFSQSGSNETELGVLMSLGQDNYNDSSFFEAKVIEAIVNGQMPRQINQIYEAPLTLALNLKMTLAIGWNPPFEVLIAMDEIYQNIGNRR